MNVTNHTPHVPRSELLLAGAGPGAPAVNNLLERRVPVRHVRLVDRVDRRIFLDVDLRVGEDELADVLVQREAVDLLQYSKINKISIVRPQHLLLNFNIFSD